MKKNFLLLFCFITSFAFSQEYHFDYFITENSLRVKPDNQQWTSGSFYDSVSKKSLSIRNQNDKILASIYDKENNRSHIFKVNKLKDRLTFTYKHSNQFPQLQNKKDYNKENIIKVERIDSLKYNVKVFKNSKLKKKKISAIVILKKYEFDYLNFAADYSRNDEINEKIRSFLDPNSYYMISSQYTKYYSSGYTFEESIKQVQKTDLQIIVPEKLIIKEYNYWSDFED